MIPYQKGTNTTSEQIWKVERSFLGQTTLNIRLATFVDIMGLSNSHTPYAVMLNSLTLGNMMAVCLNFKLLFGAFYGKLPPSGSLKTSQYWFNWFIYSLWHELVISYGFPESKVHGANMWPTWVLSTPDGPHVGPMNLAIRVVAWWFMTWTNATMS